MSTDDEKLCVLLLAPSRDYSTAIRFLAVSVSIYHASYCIGQCPSCLDFADPHKQQGYLWI